MSGHRGARVTAVGSTERPCLRCPQIRLPGRSLCYNCHNEQRRANEAKARRLRTKMRTESRSGLCRDDGESRT
jgi:hypothetical protein